MEQLKILLVAATPERSTSKQAGPDESDAAREMRDIDEVLAATSDGARVDVCTLQAATWQRLHDALLRHRPHVVHIIAQGTAAAIEFETNDRLVHRVEATKLAELVRTFQDSTRLMIFSACHSAETARIAMSGKGCAVGFKETVTSVETIEFFKAFYRNLVSGETIETAFERARALIARCDPVLVGTNDLARRPLLPPISRRNQPVLFIGATLFTVALLVAAGMYSLGDDRPGFLVIEGQPDSSTAHISDANPYAVIQDADARLMKSTPDHGSEPATSTPAPGNTSPRPNETFTPRRNHEKDDSEGIKPIYLDPDLLNR